MPFVDPIKLAAHGVRLIPLELDHEAGIRTAAADSQLCYLPITSVPAPDDSRGYIESALTSRDDTIRDTVMYSLHSGECPEVHSNIDYLLSRPHIL